MFVAALSGCARRVATVATPARVGWTETGVASWYGVPYHGRLTSSGEIYDMEKLTAAHQTLPFNTWLAVENLSNGKTVEVRINDRGPFVGDRIIDLSHAAARDIDMLSPGTARVRLRVIATPADYQPASDAVYAVQVGAFSDQVAAEGLRTSVAKTFPQARVINRPPLWCVLVGAGLKLDEANLLREKAKKAAGAAIVVPSP